MKNRHKLLDEISKKICDLSRIIEKEANGSPFGMRMQSIKDALILSHDELSRVPNYLALTSCDKGKAEQMEHFTEAFQEITNRKSIPDLRDTQTRDFFDFWQCGYGYGILNKSK